MKGEVQKFSIWIRFLAVFYDKQQIPYWQGISSKSPELLSAAPLLFSSWWLVQFYYFLSALSTGQLIQRSSSEDWLKRSLHRQQESKFLYGACPAPRRGNQLSPWNTHGTSQMETTGITWGEMGGASWPGHFLLAPSAPPSRLRWRYQ